MVHRNRNVNQGIHAILVGKGGRMRVTAPSTPRNRRATKHDRPIKIDATPEQVARSLFTGKPKPADRWRYLKTGRSTA